ncbi:hypothetical protein AAC387_Pa07g2885 [Persea americana]
MRKRLEKPLSGQKGGGNDTNSKAKQEREISGFGARFGYAIEVSGDRERDRSRSGATRNGAGLEASEMPMSRK